MRKVTIIILLITVMGAESLRASTGQLEIINKADNMPQNSIYTMDHWPGSSEGYVPGDPDYDTDYNPIFTPSGLKTKLISKVEGHELEYDSRPLDNNFVDVELSLHSESGNPITVSSVNYLELVIDPLNNGWDFGNLPITLQEYNPADPNEEFPMYDVRKSDNWNQPIPLDQLNGTYNSEEPYAYLKLAFDKYVTDLDGDQKTDNTDFAIFSDAWLRTVSQADRESPSDLGAYADYDLSGDVGMSDLLIFIDNWLFDAYDSATW